MAAFATFAAAADRAKAMMTAKTWIVAHAEKLYNGAPAVRFIRPMSAATASGPTGGGWVETTDDAVV
jgi:hypothetical protein